MLIDRSPLFVDRRRRAITERFVFQLLAGSIVALGFPVLIIYLTRAVLPDAIEVSNSMIAAGTAFVVGLVLSRRLQTFPGIVRIENELPIFIATYSLAAVTLLVLRTPYSNVYLLSSFALAVLMALVFATQTGRRQPVFMVVPFGNMNRLASIRGARFVRMDYPRFDPQLSGSGLVADLRADLPDEWERALADAALHGCPVFHIKLLEEALTGKVDIEHLSENSLGSLLPNRAFSDIKTIVDRALAIAVVPILAVPMVLLALAIRLDSPGPVLFRQQRVGRGGLPFQLYKFRSMRHRERDDDERAAAITSEGDGRVTRIGRFIRRYRIDELPQIINILKGEMSWIGPRPEALALSRWYEAELPFYSYRHIVAPGLTGWAQVNQGHVADLPSVHDKLRFDFYYIKNFSPWLDLLIVLRTMRIVLVGFGAK